MTEHATRALSPRRLRRALALAAAVGLASLGILAAAPAMGVQAAPLHAVSVTEHQEAIVPIGEETAIEPISAVLEEAARPLGLSVFVVSAVTLGAGAIVAARLIAHNRQRVPAAAPGSGRGVPPS